jgi:hypothetical protein
VLMYSRRTIPSRLVLMGRSRRMTFERILSGGALFEGFGYGKPEGRHVPARFPLPPPTCMIHHDFLPRAPPRHSPPLTPLLLLKILTLSLSLSLSLLISIYISIGEGKKARSGK